MLDEFLLHELVDGHRFDQHGQIFALHMENVLHNDQQVALKGRHLVVGEALPCEQAPLYLHGLFVCFLPNLP